MANVKCKKCGYEFKPGDGAYVLTEVQVTKNSNEYWDYNRENDTEVQCLACGFKTEGGEKHGRK